MSVEIRKFNTHAEEVPLEFRNGGGLKNYCPYQKIRLQSRFTDKSQ